MIHRKTHANVRASPSIAEIRRNIAQDKAEVARGNSLGIEGLTRISSHILNPNIGEEERRALDRIRRDDFSIKSQLIVNPANIRFAGLKLSLLPEDLVIAVKSPNAHIIGAQIARVWHSLSRNYELVFISCTMKESDHKGEVFISELDTERLNENRNKPVLIVDTHLITGKTATKMAKAIIRIGPDQVYFYADTVIEGGPKQGRTWKLDLNSLESESTTLFHIHNSLGYSEK